jgi:hypothetical protein
MAIRGEVRVGSVIEWRDSGGVRPDRRTTEQEHYQNTSGSVRLYRIDSQPNASLHKFVLRKNSSRPRMARSETTEPGKPALVWHL